MSQNKGERNFHIFYQLCTGATSNMKCKDTLSCLKGQTNKESIPASFGIVDLDYYKYLCHGGNNNRVDGTNDAHDFQETLKGAALSFALLKHLIFWFFSSAMSVMGISETDKDNILKLTAGVLHLGNVNFVENGNNAVIEDPSSKSASQIWDP